MHNKMSILFFFFLNFRDLNIWYCNFFRFQTQKLKPSSSLSLILSLCLAWLINQVKLKFFGFFTSSSSNIIFRLVMSSSQVWVFYFSWSVNFEYALLNKTWFVYSPTHHYPTASATNHWLFDNTNSIDHVQYIDKKTQVYQTKKEQNFRNESEGINWKETKRL